jgi:hypothetical protein
MGLTPPVNKIRQEADGELNRKGWNPSNEENAHISIEIEIGTINVVLSHEAISLMRTIQSDFSKEELDGMMREKTVELTEWYSRLTDQYKNAANISVDRSGFLVKTEGIEVPNMVEEGRP